MPIRQIVRPHPLAFQSRTLAATAVGIVKQKAEEIDAVKVEFDEKKTEIEDIKTQTETLTSSITSDPDIIGLVGGNAALSDPQIDGLGANASDNLDVYNGGGA